jgi:hypothetical protein
VFVLKKQGELRVSCLQGGLVPNKISGVGTNFGLLVHDLPGPNKQREATRSKTEDSFELN